MGELVREGISVCHWGPAFILHNWHGGGWFWGLGGSLSSAGVHVLNDHRLSFYNRSREQRSAISDQRFRDNFGESGIVEFQKEKSQGKGMESLIPSKRRKE